MGANLKKMRCGYPAAFTDPRFNIAIAPEKFRAGQALRTAAPVQIFGIRFFSAKLCS
ncbi:hypothetical protein LJC36_01075 [Desulfovibrio sp. OttesenSCG-928-C14]|nr:hypothetical protein [Desulfovibrio sp. OttesenSCG-928-C14]